VAVEDVEGMRRPDLVRLVLETLDIDAAVAAAERARRGRAIRRATGTGRQPGRRLHVLAMGVSHFGLRWADQDASDVVSTLVTSQGGEHGLYADVLPQRLRNDGVTRGDVFAALETVERAMAGGGERDRAVVFFAGHGEMLADGFYLVTHRVAHRTSAAIAADGLSVADLSARINAIAQHGQVLVLLDACHAGAFDVRLLRDRLKRPQVAVFASSAADEKSVEREEWRNGAFTEAFLDALKQADDDGNGLIGVADLQRYLNQKVTALTGGAQQLAIDVGFEREIFAAL
jgi:hypothetical protein